jgi:hypothetical protein
MSELVVDGDPAARRRHRMGQTGYQDGPLLNAEAAKIRRGRRRLRTTIGLLVAAIAAFGFAALLFIGDFVEGPITAFIAILPAAIGLSLLVHALKGEDSYSCSCPGCGALLEGLSAGVNRGILCRTCHGYFEGRHGKLWRIEEDRIADQAIFGSPLPQQPRFPEGCCVCGGPEVRRDEIEVTAPKQSDRDALGGDATSWAVISAQAPHCEEHREGAILAWSPSSGVRVKFRSYPYLRAFCERNQTLPG